MLPSLVARLNALQYPIIVPVEDVFTVTFHKNKTGRLFAIVTNPYYKDGSTVCEWMEGAHGGNWLVPVINVAGEAWRINPRYSVDGWQWLVVKAV